MNKNLQLVEVKVTEDDSQFFHFTFEHKEELYGITTILKNDYIDNYDYVIDEMVRAVEKMMYMSIDQMMGEKIISWKELNI